jgi:hypothetical protein
MQQQINLYLKIDRKKIDRFNVATVLAGAAALAVLLLLVSAGIGISNAALQQQLVQRQSELEALKREVESSREALRQLSDVRELDNAIARLERDAQLKRRVIGKLASMPEEANGGFSGLLAALGEAPVAGMWFTSISFDDGGESVALKGESRTPELLPEYLQQLSSQPAFSGRRFSVLRMQQQAAAEGKANILAFELHSNRASAEDPQADAKQPDHLYGKTAGLGGARTIE